MAKLTDILACPRCSTALLEFSCPSCHLDFPVHDGVPWLVSDPKSTLSEWRNRWQAALADLEKRQRAARTGLSHTTSDATTTRLKTLADGLDSQHRAMKSLLSHLALTKPADLETYLALKTRLPSQMALTSYTANVFRDWCWGDDENSVSHRAVQTALPDSKNVTVLVLGAGAGRLAFDLHQSLEPALSVALEINPYLTTVLKTMAVGGSLELHEFPLAPISGNRSAIKRKLKAPDPAADGFEVLLADAMRPPFLESTFDVVITPWLVDVIDAAPEALLREVNRLLKVGGRWIYHGSLAFSKADVTENLDLDELVEIAGACGFEGLTSSEEQTAYLNCPDSRHGRMESIITLYGDKASDAGRLEQHQNLPDWLSKGRLPIPLLPAFQSQALATRIHAFIMSLIDGKRTLKDLAQTLEAQQLMSREEAETAIRGFLIKMLDEAKSGRGF